MCVCVGMSRATSAGFCSGLFQSQKCSKQPREMKNLLFFFLFCNFYAIGNVLWIVILFSENAEFLFIPCVRCLVLKFTKWIAIINKKKKKKKGAKQKTNAEYREWKKGSISTRQCYEHWWNMHSNKCGKKNEAVDRR